MELASANDINKKEKLTSRLSLHGLRSDDFWNTLEHLKGNFSNGIWNGIEQTLDDLEIWEIVKEIKENFSNGILIGLEKTLKDVIFWVMSWNIWEVYNVRDWIRHFLTLVERSIWMMEKFYFKIFNHNWMPVFIQSRIAFLKIPLHLQTLADFVQSRNKMLEKPTLEALKEAELSSELKPTPTVPSTAKVSKDQSLVVQKRTHMLKKSIPQQKSNAVESNSEVELKELTNLATLILPPGVQDNIWPKFLCQNGLEGLHANPEIHQLNGGYRGLTVRVSGKLAAQINKLGGKGALESYTVTAHCRKIISPWKNGQK